LTFLLLVAAIGLGIWLFLPRQAKEKHIARNLSEGPRLGGELRNWLADIERGPTNSEAGNGDFHIQDKQHRNRRDAP